MEGGEDLRDIHCAPLTLTLHHGDPYRPGKGTGVN